MNGCHEIRERLSEFIDGALDPDTASRIRSHLDSCAPCREEMTSLRAVCEVLGAMKPVDPPADFIDRLHDRMAPRSFFRRVARWFFSPLKIKLPLELATAAAVGVLLFIVLKPQQAMKPVMAPAPAVLFEETPRAPEPFRSMKAGEADRKGSTALVGGLPEASDKVETPLEIAVFMKARSVFSGKIPDEAGLKADRHFIQSAPQVSSEKSMEASTPSAEGKTAPDFAFGEKAEKNAAKRSMELFREAEPVEAGMIRRVEEIGGTVIESVEKKGEKILLFRMPKDALGRLREILETFGAVVSYPNGPLQMDGDFMEVRVRFVFKE